MSDVYFDNFTYASYDDDKVAGSELTDESIATLSPQISTKIRNDHNALYNMLQIKFEFGP